MVPSTVDPLATNGPSAVDLTTDAPPSSTFLFLSYIFKFLFSFYFLNNDGCPISFGLLCKTFTVWALYLLLLLRCLYLSIFILIICLLRIHAVDILLYLFVEIFCFI